MPTLARSLVRFWLGLVAVASVALVTWAQFGLGDASTLGSVPTALLLAMMAMLVCPVGAVACAVADRRMTRISDPGRR